MTAAYDQAQLLYLQHLGIDVWVPRDTQLNNAQQVSTDASAPSFEAVADAPVLEQNAPQPGTSVALEPSVDRSPVSAPVQEPVPETVINPVSAPAFPVAMPEIQAQSAAPTVNRSEVVPEFTLNYWCYRSGLWVVTAEMDLTPAHHGFVHNVAQAIQGMKSKPKHVGMFVWPMLDAPNVDQGETVAKRYLAEHFEQLKAFIEPTHLLCFAGSEQWLTDLDSTKVPATLTEAMGNAQSKRQLWQQIQSLRSLF